ADVDVRAHADAPAGDVSAQIELIVAGVVPGDPPERSTDLQIAQLSAETHVTGQIGHRKTADDVRQLDAILETSFVTAGARVLERNFQFRVTVERLPEDLCVAEESHSVGTPVVENVGKHVHVHERAGGLTTSDLLPLPPGMQELKRRLSLL